MIRRTVVLLIVVFLATLSIFLPAHQAGRSEKAIELIGVWSGGCTERYADHHLANHVLSVGPEGICDLVYRRGPSSRMATGGGIPSGGDYP